MEDCYVCKKQNGQIVIPGGAIYEDDLVYASHLCNEEGPTYLGYLMAETKRHTPGFEDLTDAEAQPLACWWRGSAGRCEQSSARNTSTPSGWGITFRICTCMLSGAILARRASIGGRAWTSGPTRRTAARKKLPRCANACALSCAADYRREEASCCAGSCSGPERTS